jgi:hypothetical protein
MFDLDPATTTVVRDDGKGTLRTNKGSVLKIADPDCPGDGTVPLYSARRQQSRYCDELCAWTE